MNKKMIQILMVLVLLFPLTVSAATFFAEERLTIDLSVGDDLYIAGGQVIVDSEVDGDLIIGGGEIEVNNTVQEDLIIGGGRIYIDGDINDDVRIVGGQIDIRGNIQDDLIIAGGGQVRIFEGSTIGGDLIVNGGEVRVDANIAGSAIINAGRVVLAGEVGRGIQVNGGIFEIYGSITGDSKLVADEIIVGESAVFLGSVDYWTAKGKVDFGSANATYREDLARMAEKWEYDGARIFAFFSIMSFLSGLLLIALFVYFRKFFSSAALVLDSKPLQSFGLGILYFILTPIAVMLLMMTMIALPIAMFILFAYIFTIVFALPVTSIVATALLVNKMSVDWNNWQFFGMNILVYALFKFLILVPFVGFLLVFLSICLAFGAIMLRKKSLLGILTKEIH